MLMICVHYWGINAVFIIVVLALTQISDYIFIFDMLSEVLTEDV